MSSTPDNQATIITSETRTENSNAHSTWSILKRLLPYIGNYRKRVLLSVVALLVAAAATLAMPVAFRYLIDLGFSSPESGTQTIAGNYVDTVFLALFGLATILAVSTAVRFYSVSWLGERITADIRNDVFSQVLKQDPGFFESLKVGEVLSSPKR